MRTFCHFTLAFDFTLFGMMQMWLCLLGSQVVLILASISIVGSTCFLALTYIKPHYVPYPCASYTPTDPNL